jgi:hypothetical protein
MMHNAKDSRKKEIFPDGTELERVIKRTNEKDEAIDGGLVMRTTQQTVGRKEPNHSGSASESGKTVPIKKRGSRSGPSDRDTVTCADSSENRRLSSVEDLDAQIAMRAYELYRQRGGCHGEDQADWFKAERQILSTG